MATDVIGLVNQLRSTLGTMEVMLGTMADAIVWTDTNGTIQWCNAAFDRLVNQPHILVLNQTLSRLLPLTQAGELIAPLAYPNARLLREEYTATEYEFQQPLHHSDGATAANRQITLEISGNCTAVTNSPQGLCERSAVLVIRNVTGAKQAEAAIRQRAAMDHLISRISRQLIDQDTDPAVCEASSLRVIAFALEAIAEFIAAHRSAIFAYSEQRQQFDLVHEWNVADAELVSSQISELTRIMSPGFYDQILTGQPIQIPCIADLSVEVATEKAWFEERSTQSIVIVPMLHTGKVVGFLAADMIDRARTWSPETISLLQRVGELIAIAQARYKAEEKFIKAFRASPSPIAITTLLDQRFVDVNSSYLRLSGYSLEEILDRTSDELNIGATQDEYNQAIQHPPTAGSLQNQEVKFRTKSGDQRSVLLSIEPIDLSGTACVLNIIHDITERKRLENELISLVSHELRTPMTSLLGALDLLGSGQLGTLTPQGQQVLNIATKNTERLTRLVNDILDLERMRSGKLSLQKVSCNVAELLTQAAELMQAMANSANVTLITNLLDIELLADPDRILQMLANLLSNAIKFSETKRKIWLTAKLQTGEHSVLITVRDQGRGIPPDKLHVIFDRFAQVDASDSRSKGGTGLGLAICRHIVAQHDGKIWAESAVGHGSTFYVVLPLLA